VEFWQALIVAAVPSVAAIATAWLGFRDLSVRRRLESSKQFLTLFATAHGRPTDGRDAVGLGEQIATLNLIADFAVKEPLMRNAAVAGLKHFSTWNEDADASVDDILSSLLASLPEQQAAEVAARAVNLLRKSDSNRCEISRAAIEALKRIQ
jgi:hypothetical protein